MFNELKTIDGLLSARRSPDDQWVTLGPLHHLKRLSDGGVAPETLQVCAYGIMQASTDVQLWACRVFSALHPE